MDSKDLPGMLGTLRRAAARASNPGVLAGLVALGAFAWLWFVVSPLARHTNDTDASATVLYFDRIIHGRRLEAFVPTTPKPLLTLVYGLAWNLTGDWRSLTVLTVGMGAAAAGLLARLAARLAGPGAAIVSVVALLAWPDFQLEVARANSYVWGLGLWLVAAALITADTPRPWPAGVVLALAGLARTETIWLVAAATACVAPAAFFAWRGRGSDGLRLAAPLLLGWLAIPLACLHDLILTGQPLYWLGVPAGYTVLAYPDLASQPPLEMVKHELVHYRSAVLPLLLALAGAAFLVASRRKALLFATVSLAAGVMATLVVLGWRATYISSRYYEEADVAILLLAAIGLACLLRLPFEFRRRRVPAEVEATPRRRRLAAAAPPLLASLLILGTVLVAVPRGTVDASVRSSADAYAALESRMPDLKAILKGAEGATVRVAGVGYPVADPAACRVFVPRQFIPTISIEADAPVTALGDSTLAFRDRDYSELRPGQWVLHIAAADGSSGPFAPFERALPSTLALGGRLVRLVPVVADPASGLWLVRVEAFGLV